MKKYRVKVNGKVYEVELEAVEKVEGSIDFKKEKKEVEDTEHSTDEVNVYAAEGTRVKAFMQGKIVDVRVKVGDHVKEGQLLMILEAMKMENEIVSPVAGEVKKIVVAKNDTVENQETLIVIK